MKIVFVSMPSVHAVRWMENLLGERHELYWFDVLARGPMGIAPEVHQITGWKKRKLPRLKGEYTLSRKFPDFYKRIQPFLEVTASEALEKIIVDIRPDLVHSFEMQSCSYPILEAMQKFPKLKWMYSCWGSDLFYYRQFPEHEKRIENTLDRIDYLLTDCERDARIARELGFTGEHAGVIPGGGGFDLSDIDRLPAVKERKVILVKGYEHLLGRGLNIVKALESIRVSVEDHGFEVAVFGAHPKVENYISQNALPFRAFSRHELSHQELLDLMRKTYISIGNSISDGMPNTLLEAICMGAFPIQSNPGGVTEEVITDGRNGRLIKDSEDIGHIAKVISETLADAEMVQKAMPLNKALSKEKFESGKIKQAILKVYSKIQT